MTATRRLTLCAMALLGALVVLAWGTQPVHAHTILRDIEYATVDGISLRLDLYLPDPAPPTTVPLIIWVHGGGWRAGSKDGTYAPETLGEAYAVASVDYRLTGIETFPAQIHDVKAAVRWLRAHAEQYQFDPERFGAWGSSAGGHLVALLGVSCGHPELEGTVGDDLEASSCVQAVCDFYGPTDLLSLLEQRGMSTMRRPMAEDLLVGGPVEELEDLAWLASPMAHVSSGAPPFLIMHGSADPLVPVEQSIDFDLALREAGVESTLRIVDGAGHGFPRENLIYVKPFFDRILLCSENAEVSSADGAVHAFHRDGQTFLTWPEGEAAFFAIYRSHASSAEAGDRVDGDLLAIVDAATSINERASAIEGQTLTYVIAQGEDALAEETGLFVHTTANPGDFFYAVAACTQDGRILDWIGSLGPLSEDIDVPLPVLQSAEKVRDSVRTQYVHWAPTYDTSAAQALCNRPSQAFNFVVWEPSSPQLDSAAVFALHGGGGSYANALPIPNQPSVTVISPDSYVPGFPEGLDRGWDAWYGYNENVGTDLPLADGLNIDYTTRRLRWMAQWLPQAYPTIDPNRIFLRGSSMVGVGTVFSAIVLRDIFAAGIAIVPRFDYGADDVFLESFDTFGTRWGSIEDNLMTSDGIGLFDRMDAGFLAQANPGWDFAPVWAFNGRNDTAVGWSEKIPFYEAMNDTAHGWAFFWDLRAHGGQAPYPRAWRENGWEEDLFDWMIANVRLDQSYPAFSNCSIDDDPGNGQPGDGDSIGTINGYLRWDPASLIDSEFRWSIMLLLSETAPRSTCTVDVTPRRLQMLRLEAGQAVRYQVISQSGAALLDATGHVSDEGWLTLPRIPVAVDGVRLVVKVAN